MSRMRTSTRSDRVRMSEEDRARERQKARERYYANRDLLLQKRREYYQRTLNTRRAERARVRYKSRGLDPKSVPEKKSEQCDICKTPSTKMCADHNHATGQFRGWLCDRCNRALGLFHDDVQTVTAALSYLQR